MKRKIIAAILAVIMALVNFSAAPMPAEADEPERMIAEYAAPEGEHWSVSELGVRSEELGVDYPSGSQARHLPLQGEAYGTDKPVSCSTAEERAVKDASPYKSPTAAGTAGGASPSPTEEEASEGVKFIATAYCPCAKCCGAYALNRPLDENGEPIGYTATGTRATQGRTIAVDPAIIPYGTHVLINGAEYVAEDCGGAVKGHHIDIYFADHAAAEAFAVQTVTVVQLGDRSEE